MRLPFRVRAAVATLGVALALSSCTVGKRPVDDAGTTVELPAGAGRPDTPVWVDDSLYFIVESGNSDGVGSLWRWKSGGRPEKVGIDLTPVCVSGAVGFSPFALARGHLGVVVDCGSAGHESYRLVDFDVASAATQVLLAFPRLPATIAWSDQAAYIAVHDDGCEGMVRSRAGALDPLDSEVKFGDRSWPLGRWVLDGASTCPDTGLVDSPYLAKDGTELLLLAAPSAMQAVGAARKKVPWGVYVVPSTLGEARPIATEFFDPRGMNATPDGRIVVVAGEHDGTQGIWRVDTSGGSVTSIAPGDKFYDPVVSGDGKWVAVIDYAGRSGARLRVLPVS